MQTLFRFRQDLRLSDNTGLFHALQDSKEVLPIFIFDTTILDNFPKPDTRLHFLTDAVIDLDRQLREQGSGLHIYIGDPREIIPQLIKQYQINALYHNKSYGLGSQTRDTTIQKSCKDMGVIYKSWADFLLVEPEAIEQRKVFTPYFNLWKKVEKRKVETLGATNPPPQAVPLPYQGGNIDFQEGTKNSSLLPLIRGIPRRGGGLLLKSIDSHNIKQHIIDRGYIDKANPVFTRPIDGRNNRFLQDFGNYGESRNHLWDDGTTKLSPYMRFGLVSIRQIYEHFCNQHNSGSEIIVSELAWREFWHHIMHYFPETINQSFQEKRRNIQRENNVNLFEARKEGKTGYPIIDAAMIQLKQENRMHNRARMIVASFLTKDLLIDWTRGEKHFADYLLDYDSNVNIGNRQRAASVGADPKPLRIFSPILQAQRFDPQAIYIKKYLPELAHIPADRLHDPLKYRLPYTAPIVDHAIAQRRAKEVYKG